MFFLMMKLKAQKTRASKTRKRNMIKLSKNLKLVAINSIYLKGSAVKKLVTESRAKLNEVYKLLVKGE